MSGGNCGFRLGPFTVNPASNELRGPAGTISLEPKVMAVLAVLARRSGEVVTRDELVSEIWHAQCGGDESLTRAVSILRRALGSRSDGGGYIDTIPKRGYRLHGVESSDKAAVPHEPASLLQSNISPGFILPVALLSAGILFAVVVWWLGGPETSTEATTSQGERPIVAVLPFEFQGDSEQDSHLADGLSDEILSALTRSPSLAVVAGASSFRFREQRKNLDLLRRELSVTHVVDGSIRRNAGALRVAVHLVDVASGLVLWSDTVERQENSFFSIPSQVSRPIFSALGASVPDDLSVSQPPDPGAYHAYLQARALLRDGTPDNLKRAIGLLQTSVEVDPSLGGAWEQLSVALLNLLVTKPNTKDYIDPLHRRQAARRAAERALELDPGSVDARISLAILDYRERRISLADAEARFRELTQIAPSHPNANVRMGMMLRELGHVDASYQFHRRAFDVDRFSGLTSCLYAISLFETGRWSGAHALVEDINRNLSMEYRPVTQFAVLLLEERFEKARDWLQGLAESEQSIGKLHVPNRSDRLTNVFAILLDELENQGTATEATIARLADARRAGLLSPIDALEVFGAAGRLDEAIDLIRERLALGDRYFRGALFRPSLSALRADPRIMSLFAESGQLQYWLTTDRWPDFCNQPDLPYDCRAVGEQALADLQRPVAKQRVTALPN